MFRRETPPLLRRLERSDRYWPTTRLSDALGGMRDGRHDRARRPAKRRREPAVAATAVSVSTLPAKTVWMQRNDATVTARIAREQLAAAVAVADQRRALQSLYVRATQLEELLAASVTQRAQLPEAPDDPDGTRTVGDSYDPPMTVRARNVAAHQARLAAVDARVNAARDELAEETRRIAEHRSGLAAVFDALVLRTNRLVNHHERRAGVYRRAHRRAHRRAQRPVATQWTVEPCPWVERETPRGMTGPTTPVAVA
jgi:hypothetical protein